MLKLTFLNLGIFGTVLLVAPNIALAKTSQEIERIATASTVNIGYYSKNNEWAGGSGVIYQKEGDIYTIVTNAHVACGEAEGNGCSTNATSYVITTPDNNRYQIILGTAKRISNDLDLATIQFRSSVLYPSARFADSSKVINQETIYTAGFPSKQSKLKFSKGKIIAHAKKRMANDNGGYTMLYDAFTLPGMSGSGVFNSQGEVVAIHGNGDRYLVSTIKNDFTIGEKIGINRGIPINRLNYPLSTSTFSDQQNKISADELFILGYNKSLRLDSQTKIKLEQKEAIKLVSEAIKLQPQYLHAYLVRAFLYMQLEDRHSALLDYNKAIDIDPSYDISYFGRASVKFVLADRKGSLEDYNRAVSINPENSFALESRGVVRQALGDNKGALNDFNQATKINSISGDRIVVLIGRCVAHEALGQIKETLENCNKAIEIYEKRGSNSNQFYGVYTALGVAKFRSGDKQGALADLNKAINLNTREPVPYINRGSIKYILNDKLGALADFNHAESLNSTDVNLYLGIALIKEDSGELQESLSYYKKVEEIYRQKGDILKREAVFYKIARLQKKIYPNR
jgi:tetratricopeptide (TPR) repeat protein